MNPLCELIGREAKEVPWQVRPQSSLAMLSGLYALVEAVRALTRFNESVGAVTSAGSYVSLKERIAFVEVIDRLVTSRETVKVAPDLD